jgi:hypothetical protein
MKAIRNGFVTLLVLALIGGGLYAWWNLDLRWRPRTIKNNQGEITKILEGSGWVSPGGAGPKLYMITYRACVTCIRYQESQFARLQSAGVDTRVIPIAQADLNGQSRSTPAERSTVAELWVNRSWPLYQKWTNAPPATWTAAGIPVADGDVARSSVVEVGRDTVDKLQSLLQANGVRFKYPVMIWWAKDGTMKATSGGDPHRDGRIRKDLGVG